MWRNFKFIFAYMIWWWQFWWNEEWTTDSIMILDWEVNNRSMHEGKSVKIWVGSWLTVVNQTERCWRRGVVVITTAQLHSTKPELRFCAGSNPARGVSEIRDGEDLWQWSRLEIRLNAFRRSTMPQKQFIIIIIASILEPL